MSNDTARKIDLKKIADGVRLMLEGMGEDPDRDGLKKTPERVADFYAELTEGMWQDAKSHIQALPGDSHDEMVIVKNIELYSLCEHHLLPFFGKCHVAYIPDGKVIGLSKIPRLVEAYSRRLQVQERLTNEIRDCIQDTLKPMGVAVVIECSHLCMQMRGIQKQNSVTTTSAFTGIFLSDPRTREEFLRLTRGG